MLVAALSVGAIALGPVRALAQSSEIGQGQTRLQTDDELFTLMKRSAAASVAMPDGWVFFCGGIMPRSGGLATTSSFLVKTRDATWRRTAPMRLARSRHAAVALPDGRVVVTGGVARGKTLSSVEVYSPFSDTWTVMKPLESARADHVAVWTEGRILAMGGTNGHVAASGVEVIEVRATRDGM
jgi:hypothetical protein